MAVLGAGSGRFGGGDGVVSGDTPFAWTVRQVSWFVHALLSLHWLVL